MKSHGWDTDFPSTVPSEVPPKEPPDGPMVAPAANLEEVGINKLSNKVLGPFPSSSTSSANLPPELTQMVPDGSDTKINTNIKPSFHPEDFVDVMKSSKPLAPLPTDCIEQMYSEKGPREGTPEHSALEKSKGFAYRTLLGELMYAYITCRCDIGYAVTTLSKFSTSPSPYHYKLLKGVAKYL